MRDKRRREKVQHLFSKILDTLRLSQSPQACLSCKFLSGKLYVRWMRRLTSSLIVVWHAFAGLCQNRPIAYMPTGSLTTRLSAIRLVDNEMLEVLQRKPLFTTRERPEFGDRIRTLE